MEILVRVHGSISWKTSAEKIYNKNGPLRALSFFVLWLSRHLFKLLIVLLSYASLSVMNNQTSFLCPWTLKTDKHMVCSYSVTHTLTRTEEVRRAGTVSNPKIKKSQCPFSLAWTQKSRKAPNKQLLSLWSRSGYYKQTKHQDLGSFNNLNQSKWTEVERLWTFLSTNTLTVKLMNNLGESQTA